MKGTNVTSIISLTPCSMLHAPCSMLHVLRTEDSVLDTRFPTDVSRICTAQPAMSGTSNRPAARAKRSSPFPSRSAPTTVRHAQQAAGAHGARTWSALAVSGRGREEVDVRYVHVAPGVHWCAGGRGGDEMAQMGTHGRDRRLARRRPAGERGLLVVPYRYLSGSPGLGATWRMTRTTLPLENEQASGQWAFAPEEDVPTVSRTTSGRGLWRATYSVWSRPWPWVPSVHYRDSIRHPSSIIQSPPRPPD